MNDTPIKIKSYEAIFFDLDGTLMDTAPAITHAINLYRQQFQLSPLSQEVLIPHITYGAKNLAKVTMEIEDDHPSLEEHATGILNICEDNLQDHTRLFPGMEQTLQFIESQNVPWGIVTNRFTRLTLPLLDDLQLSHRVACVVCGDTLKRAKPYPDPLLHACELTETDPKQCLYIGDAYNDIAAGKQADMDTIVANYGYRAPHENPQTWGANHCVDRPEELIKLLG